MRIRIGRRIISDVSRIAFLFGDLAAGGLAPVEVQVALQDLLQHAGFDVAPQVAALGDGDAARLFGDNDHDGVGDLAKTDGRPVARAVGFGDLALRDREDALGRHHAVAFDHGGAVVQGGVLKEDVFQQRGGHFGVQGDAALGDEFQVALLTDDDQGAGLGLGRP